MDRFRVMLFIKADGKPYFPDKEGLDSDSCRMWKSEEFTTYEAADLFLVLASGVVELGHPVNKGRLVTGAHIEQFVNEQIGWVITCDEGIVDA